MCFQFTQFLCDDWDNIYTLSDYHHEIGSMNYFPLFRVRSWNIGMRCMSLYILMIINLPLPLQISYNQTHSYYHRLFEASSGFREEYKRKFCCLTYILVWKPCSVNVVLYEISCYIGPRYNGTRLYFLLSCNIVNEMRIQSYKLAITKYYPLYWIWPMPYGYTECCVWITIRTA